MERLFKEKQMDIKSYEDCEKLCYDNAVFTEISYTNIELKSSWKQDDGKKISGLANRIPSTVYFLIIGIDDKGKYLKKDEKWAKETEANVSQHFNNYLDPSFTCSRIGVIKCTDNSYVVIIHIVGPGTLVYWNKKPYKMNGTTALEMTPVEAMELSVRFVNKRDFSNLDDKDLYDAELAKQYVDHIISVADTPAFQVLKNQTLVNCLLMLKMNDKNILKILFGTIKCRVVLYNKDTTVNKQIILQGLYKLLNGELGIILREFCQEKYGHKFDTLYPERAFKEAIANAVAHAAYFENDGDLVIELYMDRIIISNLCLPESGYFANKWFSRSHNTTNNLLMESLRIAKYVDELGRGKYLIYSDSITNGKLPPEVIIENAGRFNRWKLVMRGTTLDSKYQKAYSAIIDRYGKTEKAQIAFSLVLWKDHSVEEISGYIDGESKAKYLEILSDYRGPIFYYKEKNLFILNRWMKLIIEEGKESKTLSFAEEKRLFDIAYKLAAEYDEGVITSARLRELGDFGNSSSAYTQCSNLINKWKQEGKIEDAGKRSLYRFIQSEIEKEEMANSIAAISDALDSVIEKS